jgi:Glycosyltransferases, probably involved in cell wall biogenesis
VPVISVVIPALNDATMLRTVLELLAKQLRPADEVIVVDNGSSDDTVSVAAAGGARVLHEVRAGIWPAAAAGYDAADGDVIARLDADSRPPADWLAHIEAEFETSPDVDVITGPGDFYDGNPIAVLLGQNLYIGGYFWAMSIWLARPPIFGSNFAMRREVWLAVRSLVHREMRVVHDDLDLSLHLPAEVTVLLDESLRVGISARPFSSWRGLGRRLGWAYLTLRMHWPEDAPWRLRAAHRRARGDGEALPGTAG